jgi:3-oxoisoapionate kinase
MSPGSLPAGPLLCWYGDDFTGSSAVMEAMSAAGMPAVLFFDVPTPPQRARFADYRGIGMAGVARAQTPAWMRNNLPRFYRAMAECDAPVSLYKVCSTLDSSPEVGSIGAALEVGLPYLDGEWIPFLTAAPAIGRYQLFGNLFARANEITYRLDRHPTMSRHPVTPMHEADVRIHLGKQTSIPMGLVDYVALRSGQGAQALAAQVAAGKRIVALDVIDDDSLADAGALIWERRGRRIFAVGSQGVAYALAAYFRRAGLLSTASPAGSSAAARQIAAVSGSCSPLTGAQIEWAGQHGFTLIRVDVCKAVEAPGWKAELDRVGRLAGAALRRGESPLLFTAIGPEDPAIGAFRAAVTAAGRDFIAANEIVSKGLGHVLNSLVREGGVQRVAIAGGDTSSYAAQALDIYAITLLAATIPGAALFKACSNDPALDGLEIALKGGQMGAVDYFEQISRGGISAR